MTAKTLQAMDLVDMSQDEIDELFRKSSVGEVPNGDGKGIAIILAGSKFTRAIAQITKLLIWQGKVFHREQGFFLNKITPFRIRAVKGEIYRGESWFCGGEAIILDYSKTTLLLRRVREELREVAPGFYLAQVYWGKKRLSNFTLEF